MGMTLMTASFCEPENRSGWKSSPTNVEEMRQKILDFGVRKLDIPDPHLYFQAPGSQVLRLVGIDEDLSKYEGGWRRPQRRKR